MMFKGWIIISYLLLLVVLLAPRISLLLIIIAYFLSFLGSGEARNGADSKNSLILFIPYYYLFKCGKNNTFYKVSIIFMIIAIALLVLFYLFINLMK